VKKEYIKFLIRFLILFIVVELLLMMRWIVFSDNPLTWDEFLSDLPFMVIVCLAVVFFRGLLFMSPTSKKKVKRSATNASKKKD
jgi:uncharacterized protein (DUF983 family)